MSTLRLTTISNQSGSATVPSETVINGSAKAWVNFNGTGTVAIRAAFNVSSITDNGTGDYTVNFTTAMVDANYAVCGSSGGTNSSYIFNKSMSAVQTTTTVRIVSVIPNTSLNDDSQMHLAVFR